MTELDRSVHEDEELAREEVAFALALAGRSARSVFLPCCGSGRHIAPLLVAGAESILGVDLSPECIAIAREQHRNDPRLHLAVGDLAAWWSSDVFDLTLLLGNSWGDVISWHALQAMTERITQALAPGGTFVMDYIGGGFLEYVECTSEWPTIFQGVPVLDRRTPHYDAASRVMTIEIDLVEAKNPKCRLWQGSYQKLVLTPEEIRSSFKPLVMTSIGVAENCLPYYRSRDDLGMLARSTWWVWRKEEVMGR